MEYKSVLDAIKDNSRNYPNKKALADKRNCFTYKELWEKINKASVFLNRQGVREKDIVVIKGNQKVDFLIAFFAIQLLGATVCPLEKNIKEDRVLEIMRMVDSKFFLSIKAVENEQVVCISMKKMMNSLEEIEMTEKELPNVDNLSEILFTTGTTGKSKGIEITHKIDVAIVQNVIDSVDLEKNDVELITSPINHSLGIRRVMANLYNGSTVVVTDGVKFINDFFMLLDEYKVTGITLVPAILEQILKFVKDKFKNYNNQLHFIQLGSAHLSEENKEILIQTFPDVRLYNTYGMTESACSIILDFNKYRGKKNCIGLPTVNTTISFFGEEGKIIDATIDNPGRMSFKGPMNMKGYYKDSEETKKAMIGEYVITNDLGYQDDEGFVYFLGRQGDVINVGGIKVAPTEIEEVVMAYDIVKDCACVAIKDEITGQAPKMFIELEEGKEFDEKDIIVYLSKKLEALKLPKEYEVIDKIPRTFNGKIIRKELMNRGGLQ